MICIELQGFYLCICLLFKNNLVGFHKDLTKGKCPAA